MKLNTKHFGEIEVLDDRCITFENGLPGFDDVHRFILLDSTDPESPFKWLQSVDVPQLAFAIANPFMIKPDYDIEISDETVKGIEIENAADVAIYSIVIVPDDISRISMNLKAPIVINSKNRRGMQIILDTEKYNVRHYILDEIQKQGVAQNARADKEEGSVSDNK
jgi:flagellar assembly factor FliW